MLIWFEIHFKLVMFESEKIGNIICTKNVSKYFGLNTYMFSIRNVVLCPYKWNANSTQIFGIN